MQKGEEWENRRFLGELKRKGIKSKEQENEKIGDSLANQEEREEKAMCRKMRKQKMEKQIDRRKRAGKKREKNRKRMEEAKETHIHHPHPKTHCSH